MAGVPWQPPSAMFPASTAPSRPAKKERFRRQAPAAGGARYAGIRVYGAAQYCERILRRIPVHVLDGHLRRLKIEYDVFFGGGSKKPPNDTEWRVQNLIRKFSDSSKLTFPQRFKYNGIAQRYGRRPRRRPAPSCP